MNFDLFSIPYYMGRVYDHEKFEEPLNDFLKEEKDKCLTDAKFWNCNVLTTFTNTKDKDFTYQWQSEFIQAIKYNFFQYIDRLNYPDQEYDFSFSPPWANVYRKNDFQEFHDHMPSHFSYAYAHKVPENTGNFTFLNLGSYSIAKHYDNPQVVSKDLTVLMKEKHILIFPSFVTHMVTPNRSDDVRITVSGNVYMDQII